jgi:hypothetical protein
MKNKKGISIAERMNSMTKINITTEVLLFLFLRPNLFMSEPAVALNFSFACERSFCEEYTKNASVDEG